MERKVIVKVEPSKRLSEILGYPYYVERAFPLESFGSLLTDEDLKEMESGKEIKKSLPIKE